MAKQQKPKRDDKKGTRNSNRRNGKAFKKHPKNIKPTGRSVCGYSVERVQKMAKRWGISYEEMVEHLKARRAAKREARKAARRNQDKKPVSYMKLALQGLPHRIIPHPRKPKAVEIKRKHDWVLVEGGDTPAMVCNRPGCEAILLPWEFENSKGECTADAEVKVKITKTKTKAKVNAS